ncbi:TonB-dependent receptor [Fulvivirga sp. M361]|nr:TonB-dependent receptor [Fulvivirga sp. M361]
MLCISTTLTAHTGSISGKVISNGKPLEYATVSISKSSLGDITDESGVFKIEDVPVGTISLKVSSVGYRTLTTSLDVQAGSDNTVEITLKEDLLNLEEVVVSSTRYELDRTEAPVVVNVLSNKILAATQSIAVSEGLNYQPGVRVETNCQNCGFTQVRLNGLEGAYSQILVNSRAVFSALNSVYGLDQIPTNIVEKVEVVRSGGSALYGSNAIAGTINIITREPVENAWQIGSNFAVIDGDAVDHTVNFNGSIVSEDLNSGVTFYGMFRDRDSYDANGDGFTELVNLENNVLGAKAFLKPTDRSKLSLDFSSIQEYRRGGDRLELAPHFTDITEELDHNTTFAGMTYDFWSENQHDKFSVYSSAQVTNRGSFYGGLGGGRTPEDSLLAINAYGNTDDIAIVTGVQYTRSMDNNDVFTFGIENQFNDTEDEIAGYNRLVDQRVNTFGFYGQYEWKPTTRLTALLGARYDATHVDGEYRVGEIERSSDVNLGVFSPRVTLLYQLTDNMQFRGGYARGFRAPQAFNEDLHISSVGGEPQFVILSDGLDKETSNAYTASLSLTRDFGLTQTNFLIEGFYTQLVDPFVQVSTGSVLPNGSILEEVRNGSGASVSGVNFETGFSPSRKFSFQLGGTAQRALFDEEQILFEPEGEPDGESVVVVDEFTRNPNLYGYFTSNWNVTEAFRFDFTGTYTGAMIVPRVVNELGFLDLIESDPFLDMNIKASYHFDVRENFHLELSGGVKNIFNSYQDDFDSGAGRDSDYIYGPAAPRSIFVSVKIGNLH